MEIDGNLERRGSLENRREEEVVEIAAPGVAVDDGALEGVISSAALKFLGGAVRTGGGHHGESAKATRIFSNGVGEEIVGLASEGNGVGRVKLFHAGRGERENLHVDAGLVHFRDALCTHVGELLDELRKTLGEVGGAFFELLAGTVEKSRAGEVFFQGYGAHRSSGHRASFSHFAAWGNRGIRR